MAAKQRIFFDIETAPNIMGVWKAGYKKTVPHQFILKERSIICVCWKFAGGKKVHHLTWDKNQCDKKLLETFIPILNSATEILAHNGDRFDLRWLRTRCLYHDIDMFPNYVSIDTLKQAQRYFYFNSNSLAYITKFLGLDGKIKTDADLWIDIFWHKDAKALKDMVVYCKNDVTQLEEVFRRFSKYIPNARNYATHANHCPECNSDRMHIRAYRVTAQGYKQVQLQCQECGKYHSMALSRFKKGATL